MLCVSFPKMFDFHEIPLAGEAKGLAPSHGFTGHASFIKLPVKHTLSGSPDRDEWMAKLGLITSCKLNENTQGL